MPTFNYQFGLISRARIFSVQELYKSVYMRVLVFGMMLLGACDCAASTVGVNQGAVCKGDSPPKACGSDCDSIKRCTTGMYCGADMRCTADCLPGDDSCGAGYTCNAQGRCVVVGGGGDGGLTDGNICATVNVGTSRSTPNIMLLVDRSGSMDNDFINTNSNNKDEESRWEAFDRAVFSASGPIAQLQGSARIGMTFYTRHAGGDENNVACGHEKCPEETCLGDSSQCSSSLNCMRCPTPSCLQEGSADDSDIIATAPQLDQFSVLKQMLTDFGPDGDTPTGDSIDFVRPGLAALAASTREPTLLIIATDGAPDRCEDHRSNSNRGLDTIFDGDGVLDGMEESLLAAHTARTAGIDSYIISLGSGAIALSHLQQMANVGLGLDQYEPAATEADYYVATDTSGLTDAINAIIGGAVTCNLTLSQPIKAASACNGQVTYNGAPLACNPADGNGWFAGAADTEGNTSTIELRGAACDTLKRDGGVVAGAFPCDVIVVVD